MAVITIGWFVNVGTLWVAEIVATRISPEGRVDYSDIFLGNGFRVVAVIFVEAFFECVIHGVDCGFSVFITLESVEIGLLDEKEEEKQTDKGSYDNKFDNGETFFVSHVFYYNIFCDII